MEQIEEYYKRVEDSIALAGIDPVLTRSETEGQWNLLKDTLEVWIDVMHVEQNGRTYFQVMSPICEVPDHRKEEFYKEMLDLNYQMIDAHFVTFQEGAYIKIMREIDNMKPEDMLLAMNRVGHYGSIYEEEFIKKYETAKITHKE